MYGKNYDDFFLQFYFKTVTTVGRLGNHMKKLTAVRRLEKVKLTLHSFKVIVIFSQLSQFVKFRWTFLVELNC